MKSVARAEIIWAAVLGAALFLSALGLVELHWQARQLFVAHEHEADVHRRLLDDQANLEMQVRRASLAGNIGAGAAMLDLAGATGVDTVTLVESPDGRIDFLPDLRRELDAVKASERTEAKGMAGDSSGPGAKP